MINQETQQNDVIANVTNDEINKTQKHKELIKMTTTE